MNSQSFVVSLLVSNHYGVLTRISGLFSKRGFNIDNLTVSPTQDPEISRMTILSSGDGYVKNQIVRQLEKLVDVRTVELMQEDKTVVRELMLVKVGVGVSNRSEVLQAVDVFRARVVDMSPSSLSMEVTGEPSKLDAFLQYLLPFGIMEMCRTGVTALGRDGYCLACDAPQASCAM